MKNKAKSKNIDEYPTLESLAHELFTKDMWDRIQSNVEKEVTYKNALAKSIQEELRKYMEAENIGFNTLTERLNLSTATTAKLIKGTANITLATLASISVVLGKDPSIKFRPLSKSRNRPVKRSIQLHELKC